MSKLLRKGIELQESIESFLARGGKITVLESNADKVASKVKGYKCTTHFRFNKDAPLEAYCAATVKGKHGYNKIKFQ